MSNESFKKVTDTLTGKAQGLFNEGKSTIAAKLPDIVNTVKDEVGSLTNKFTNLRNSVLSTYSNKFYDLKSIKKADVVIQDSEKDWRIRLSMPNSMKDVTETDSDLLAPLMKTSGFVFPYTPTVLVSQSANYQSIQPVHTNYPYYSYQNSQVDQMTITGDFFVQNAAEARYWVACIHYLRSITKMNYGIDADAGQPPPVVRLNGYGDFVFNNVPVIINSFQFDMPKDVDYISTSIGEGTLQANGPHQDISTGPTGWAPSTSIVTVNVTPQYSRTTQSTFSLNKFIKGGYMKSGDGFI
jgi:hypothetical protein